MLRLNRETNEYWLMRNDQTLPLHMLSFLSWPGDGNSYTVNVLQQPHGVSGSGEDPKGTGSHSHDGSHQYECCADNYRPVQPGGGLFLFIYFFKLRLSLLPPPYWCTECALSLQILHKVSLTDPSREKTLHILAVIREKSALSQSSLRSRTHHLSPMYLSAAMVLAALSWQYLNTTAAQAQGTSDMQRPWTNLTPTFPEPLY